MSLFSKVLDVEMLLQKELEEQGHVAFGNLLNSISSTIEKGDGYTDITFFALDYGKYVNQDYSASEMWYVPLEGNFKEWIMLRFNTSDEKEIKSIYFAIHNKWFKEGKPTQESYKYSENGKRTEWIDSVAEKLPEHFEEIGEVAANELINGLNFS